MLSSIQRRMLHGRTPFIALTLTLFLSACSSTPQSIHEAAQSGNIQAVQKFLDRDPALAKSNAGPKQRTPLHLAKTSEIVELLISKGADINAVDQDGYTPIHTALSGPAAEALIKHGADVSKPAGDNFSPLFTCEHPDVVPVLIAHGARINESLPRQPYKTPLWYAVYEGRTEMATALLQNGALASNTDSSGETYLHMATDKDHAEIVEALIKGGAFVNYANQNGETPLLHAVIRNALKSAEVLLKNGADPKLTLASNVSFMSFSVNGPAKTTDVGGKNALQLAPTPEMKDLLQKYGAK